MRDKILKMPIDFAKGGGLWMQHRKQDDIYVIIAKLVDTVKEKEAVSKIVRIQRHPEFGFVIRFMEYCTVDAESKLSLGRSIGCIGDHFYINM